MTGNYAVSILGASIEEDCESARVSSGPHAAARYPVDCCGGASGIVYVVLRIDASGAWWTPTPSRWT